MTVPPAPISIANALRSARDTRALEIGSAILNQSVSMFREQFGAKPAVIVTDSIVWPIAGQAVANSFASASPSSFDPFVYRDASLYAEFGYVEQLETILKKTDAIPVAVGAGTINDLTKLAAHRAGRPYMCVATAASMDGYTAFGASITHHGSKQTFTCPAPKAVLADLDVIRAAPPEMNASGYADFLAKTTAGADWILADALGAEPIAPEAWRIVQGGLREMLSAPEGIKTGTTEAISRLTQGLMLAGFAMQSAQTSRAASGAEHQFSHLWDMQHHTHKGRAPSHGFKVGIATLGVTALYECLLSYPVEKLDVNQCCESWPTEAALDEQICELFPDGDLRTVALQETRAKKISTAELCSQLERLRAVWPQLKSRLQEQLLPFPEAKAMLRAAGAACEPQQIGISRERLRASYAQAALIRRRFTVLDVVSRAGLLDHFLDRIFGPAGPWPLNKAPAATIPTHS